MATTGNALPSAPVNWEHLAAARRDALVVREPGTDCIQKVSRGENWLWLDGLLINIVANGDRIVSEHFWDPCWTWGSVRLHIRKGGLEKSAAGSDFLVVVERQTFL
jgi:hypothetical protein